VKTGNKTIRDLLLNDRVTPYPAELREDAGD